MSAFDKWWSDHVAEPSIPSAKEWRDYHASKGIAMFAWNAALRRAAGVVRNYPLPHAPDNALADSIAEAIEREIE